MDSETKIELIDVDSPVTPDRIDRLREQLGFLTEDEFALALGVHPRTVQDWRLSGKPYPPNAKIGRVVILPIRTTAEWLVDQLRGVSLEVTHRASPRRRRAG